MAVFVWAKTITPDYTTSLFGQSAADTYPLKSWLASAVAALALFQLFSALRIYGRLGPARRPRWLGTAHRLSGAAAIERPVYRGHDEVASGLASLWQTWDVLSFEEGEVRDVDDSVVWLGRAKLRGRASQVELDQEFALHFLVHDGRFIRVHAFLTWTDALKAVGLRE